MKNKKSIVVSECFKQLGTDIDIRIVVEDEILREKATSDILSIREIYNKLDAIFSRFESVSELSRLNSNLGIFNKASVKMRELIELSFYYNRETDGLFDPRIIEILENIGYEDDFLKGVRQIGDEFSKDKLIFNKNLSEDLKMEAEKVLFKVRMDFSGIAKGYINDEVVRFLQRKGYQNFLVDSGGDMFLSGLDEDGLGWTVGVEDVAEKKVMFILDRMAIATSGIGRRKWELHGRRLHHLVNPRNPWNFSFELKSVTVIAESTIKADVLAKTIFLLGLKDGMLYIKKHEIPAIILDSRGAAWISPWAKKFLK